MGAFIQDGTIPNSVIRTLTGSTAALLATQAIVIFVLWATISKPREDALGGLFNSQILTLRKLICLPDLDDATKCRSPVSLFSIEEKVGELSVMALVLAALLLTAIVQGLNIAFFKRYTELLDKGTNFVSKVEHGISSGILVVAVGAVVGIQDIGSIVMLFMGCMGAAFLEVQMERANPADRSDAVNWVPTACGQLVGLAPLACLSIYFFNSNFPLPAVDQGFAEAAYFVLVAFVWLLSPAAKALHYLNIGPLKDYRVLEAANILSSFVFKSGLAWLLVLYRTPRVETAL